MPHKMLDANGNKEKDNLARIRDNQRRSRARRKEYLQELETKYRLCEQLGVEASAEIQSAARKVLEENKRLRELLRIKGVPENEIESFVPRMSSVSSGCISPTSTSASASLASMIGSRKACNPQTLGRLSISSVSGGPAPTSRVPMLQQQAQPQAQPHPTPIQAYSTALPISPTTVTSTGMPTPAMTAAPITPPSSTGFDAQAISHGFSYAFPQSEWHFALGTSYMADSVSEDPSVTTNMEVAAMLQNLKSPHSSGIDAGLGCNQGQEYKVPSGLLFDPTDRYTVR